METGLSRNDSLACLEIRQLSHSWFRCMILGNPVAIFFSPIILSIWKFTCLSLACHSQTGSANFISREVGWLVSNSILYKRLCDRFTYINKVPFLSNILRDKLANSTLLPSSVIRPRLIMLLFKRYSIPWSVNFSHHSCIETRLIFCLGSIRLIHRQTSHFQ